jgi:transposase
MNSAAEARAHIEALRKIPRDELVPDDAPARFVNDFVDGLDLAALGFVEPRRPNRRQPHSASKLLKLFLFGAFLRIFAQRRLAEACIWDVRLLYLSACDPPGRSSITRFWGANFRAYLPVFQVLVQRAAEDGLIGMELHALDGSKIRAASSMLTAVHRDAEEKKLKRLDKELEKLEDQLSALSVRDLRFQQERAEVQRQQVLERIALLDKHDTKHVHPNEPDARVMKCDSRRLLAYNGQALVDHDSDMIVAIGLTADENDQEQLVPMMEQTQRVLGAVAKMTDVDTGYTSGPQLHEAHKRHLPVLGPVQPEWDKGLLPKSSFAYDAERDVVVCPRGEVLPLEDRRKMSKDAPCETAIYRCHNRDCPERSGCTSDRKGRTVKRTPFDEDLERQRAQMAEPANRNLYELRKEIIEHIFGCLKSNDRFWRFLVRGLAKVSAQWAMVCAAFNLRKLYDAWTGGLFSWPTRAPAHA